MAIVDEIRKIKGVTILENEPMSRHTTFKIGGPIRAIVYPNSFDALEPLMKLLGGEGVAPLLLGNGSNLLCADEPIDRIAVCTRPDGSGYAPYMEPLGGGKLIASSGALLSQLAMLALSEGLTGLEFAAGIPGTLGGAVRMNAGAYGSEMKDVVTSVETVTSAGKRKTYKPADLKLSYRHSVFSEMFSERGDANISELISTVTVTLARGERDEIQAQMRKLSNQRKSKQPLELPSAGSTFKRPEGAYAAELIDRAGLKGYTAGGAQVSEKHAGFVVNLGGATCSDVLRVIEHVQSEVLRQFGIELEPEILLVR